MLGAAVRKNGSALLVVPLREAVAIAVAISIAVSVGIAIAITVSVTVAVSGPGDGSYGCRADAGRYVGGVTRRGKSGFRNRDLLDGRCSRPALLDRTERARSAQ